MCTLSSLLIAGRLVAGYRLHGATAGHHRHLRQHPLQDFQAIQKSRE